MSKDKYSDNHTIEVVGGSQTLTLDGNLVTSGNANVGGNANVTGNIDLTGNLVVDGTTTHYNTVSVGVGNLTVSNGDIIVYNGDVTLSNGNLSVTGTISSTGNATVGGNFDLTGDANVGGNTYSDNYIYNSTKNILKWIPSTHLQALTTQGTSPTSGIDTFTSGNGKAAYGLQPYPNLTVGHTTTPTWSFYFSIDPFLLHGSTIDSVTICYSTDSSSTTGNIDYRLSIQSASILGGSWTTLNTENFTLTGTTTTAAYKVVDVSAASIVVSNDVSVGSKYYRILFSQVDAVEWSVISLFKFGITMQVSDVETALMEA